MTDIFTCTVCNLCILINLKINIEIVYFGFHFNIYIAENMLTGEKSDKKSRNET